MKRVIVNGTFDILHVGHMRLLQCARDAAEGGTVQVLIDTDERVKQLKGPTRPINNQDDRRAMLMALRYVDSVQFFSSDQELESKIRDYEPDIMVKGSDYREKSYIGAKYCKATIYYDLVEGYSTTKKIQSITDRR